MSEIKVVGNLLDESNKFKASGRVYDGGGYRADFRIVSLSK